jgi:hypothetical protein
MLTTNLYVSILLFISAKILATGMSEMVFDLFFSVKAYWFICTKHLFQKQNCSAIVLKS